MAAVGRLNLLHRRLVGLLPEVQSRGAIPLRQKAAYTAASLAVFLVGSNLLPYWTGVRRYAPASRVVSPLYWNNSLHNANGDTVMALGVTPLVVSEFVLHAFIFLRQEIVGNGAPNYQDHTTLLLTRNNGSRKLPAILIAFGMSLRDTLRACSACTCMDTALIVLQRFLGAFIIIYIDEVLRKGYGLLSSGISLFTTANISANIFWKAFSPYYSALRGDMRRAVAVSSLLHRLISSGDDELSAMPKAWQHRELPDMTGAVATCVFFLIVLSLQGLYLVYMNNEDNRILGEHNEVTNLLGKWKESIFFGHIVPVSGIAYYAINPPTLADVLRDPADTLLYAVVLLLGFAICSTSLFAGCTYSDCYVARLLGERRIVVTVAQPNTAPYDEWRLYVAAVAFLVGLCIGALQLLAGLAGVVGSGTGIMLAVTIIYSSLEGRGRTGAFGL
ncbi:hypothetical protein BS78_07G029400 [Paspalum vaginatum]|nr:hypothetical protein BS78_07G029400 [Paspalum vaginatum]